MTKRKWYKRPALGCGCSCKACVVSRRAALVDVFWLAVFAGITATVAVCGTVLLYELIATIYAD